MKSEESLPCSSSTSSSSSVSLLAVILLLLLFIRAQHSSTLPIHLFIRAILYTLRPASLYPQSSSFSPWLCDALFFWLSSFYVALFGAGATKDRPTDRPASRPSDRSADPGELLHQGKYCAGRNDFQLLRATPEHLGAPECGSEGNLGRVLTCTKLTHPRKCDSVFA